MGRNIVEFFRDKKFDSSSALLLCYAGREQCKPNHHFGPAIRAHYLLHFIVNGKGSYHTRGKKYELGKNQMFLIKPGESTFYIADEKDPWEYIWIAFNGTSVDNILQDCGLLSENPISYYSPDSILIGSLSDIIQQLSSKTENEYALLGDLYSIFGSLSRNHYNQEYHSNSLFIKQSLSFIQNNYSCDIKVQDIADYVQIDRTYLYRIFMDEFELSPKQYLMQYRIKRASELLSNTNLSVNEIAYYCGFRDPSAFCKHFRTQLGFTPKEYRKIDGNSTLSYVDDKEKD